MGSAATIYGGGGTFVVRSSGNVPLVVAGVEAERVKAQILGLQIPMLQQQQMQDHHPIIREQMDVPARVGLTRAAEQALTMVLEQEDFKLV